MRSRDCADTPTLRLTTGGCISVFSVLQIQIKAFKKRTQVLRTWKGKWRFAHDKRCGADRIGSSFRSLARFESLDALCPSSHFPFSKHHAFLFGENSFCGNEIASWSRSKSAV